ncbi:hypothetical protein PybrP1_000504 [[Pythium] brassicae (nom. inval.)]|nr:hypothetical protein PybrP1_000504 [[Pythium] brassicae (nom. inval.)]
MATQRATLHAAGAKKHASGSKERGPTHSSVARAGCLDLSASSHAPVTYQHFPRRVIAQEQIERHLTELWLTNHRIAALPPEIALCTSLRVLGLGGNELSGLPQELSELTSLEALYLEKNRLRSLPSTPAVFPSQLRDLRLDSNEFVVFPLAVTKLKLLNQLGLSHNRVRAVPPEIRRLRNLVQLDLDFNALGPELPRELELLVHLERLGLDGNRLAAQAVQTGVLSRLPALSYLRISGNCEVEDATSLDSEQVPFEASASTLIRHDGYFHCCRSQQGGSAQPQERLVPCKEQNILNAYQYRSGLAARVHRKAE